MLGSIRCVGHHSLRLYLPTKLVRVQGVWERDEWRSEDSFETFGEVLAIAKAEAMDFVLLGGDLFHENKPSRKTLINTLQIMHKHCLGMEPVSFQVEDPQLSTVWLVCRYCENPDDCHETMSVVGAAAPHAAIRNFNIQTKLLQFSTRHLQQCSLQALTRAGKLAAAVTGSVDSSARAM